MDGYKNAAAPVCCLDLRGDACCKPSGHRSFIVAFAIDRIPEAPASLDRNRLEKTARELVSPEPAAAPRVMSNPPFAVNTNPLGVW